LDSSLDQVSEKLKIKSCIDRLYLFRLRLALKIDGDTGALLVNLLIKFLMYASDIRITLDQMPGPWNSLEYAEESKDTRGALNANLVFVIISFIVFLAQYKVGKTLDD